MIEDQAMAPRKLFETHLSVRDLQRSFAFYRDIVGLEPAHLNLERHVAFFWIGRRGSGMLGLWESRGSPNAMQLHIAFGATIDDVLAAPRRLAALGTRPLDFHGRLASEPSVIGWMPAVAVYFKDPDGHLLEYIAMLPDVPRPDVGIVEFSEWTAVSARCDTVNPRARG